MNQETTRQASRKWTLLAWGLGVLGILLVFAVAIFPPKKVPGEKPMRPYGIETRDDKTGFEPPFPPNLPDDLVSTVATNHKGDSVIIRRIEDKDLHFLLDSEGNQWEIETPELETESGLELRIDFSALSDTRILTGRIGYRSESQAPVIWSPTEGLSILDDLFPGQPAGFNDINDLGVSVGSFMNTRKDRAYTWSKKAGVRFLHEDPHPGLWPLSLNNHGEAVGAFSDSVPYPGTFNPVRYEGAKWKEELYWYLQKIPISFFQNLRYTVNVYYDTIACLWEDGTLYNLEKALSEDSDWDRLLYATDINDRGQIVGVGLIDGDEVGFLMTPLEAEN